MFRVMVTSVEPRGTALALLVVLLFPDQHPLARETVEVCMSDVFSAKCWDNEVVIMETALYGRMDFGGCVQVNLGYIGCKVDVLQLADRWCSGRRSCDVLIPGDDLEELNECLPDLRTYLQAAYRCVKVAHGSKDYCSAHRQVSLLGNSGYLSSDVATRTGCGTVHAPWVIDALPGQTIRMTLHDFGIWRLQEEQSSPEAEQNNKDMYGYVYEPTTGTNLTIYSTGERVHHLLNTQSNTVHIYIIPQRGESPRQFLIHYETVGCADLNPPKHAWYKREGDEAIIGCKPSRHEKTWHLRCVDNTWQGVVGNCSAPIEPRPLTRTDVLPFSTEVSIVIIIGIALIFAGIVLVIGVIYIKNMRRTKSQHRAKQPPATKDKPQDTCSLSRAGDAMLPKRSRPNSAEGGNPANVEAGRVQSHSVSDITSVGTGNAYTHIWERPLPDPHGTQVTSDSDYASQSNYSGATRQSGKTTGGYDTGDTSDSLYNVE